jgi:hypothetical protein
MVELRNRRAKGAQSHGFVPRDIICAGSAPPKTPTVRTRSRKMRAGQHQQARSFAAQQRSVSDSLEQFSALDVGNIASEPQRRASTRGGRLALGRPRTAGFTAAHRAVADVANPSPRGNGFGTTQRSPSRRTRVEHIEPSLVGNSEFVHTVDAMRPMTVRPGSPRRFAPRSMLIAPSWAHFRNEEAKAAAGLFLTAFPSPTKASGADADAAAIAAGSVPSGADRGPLTPSAAFRALSDTVPRGCAADEGPSQW